ncbi:hypothetical protein L2E82_11349 [Cichorium intybus]|uniref:Uncharacterized protein n=1 Tax=Cichorium intybus TaxID=13427 RepID=A0ACB9GD86_CICIN|nr:hypothetical protein L2E82_11349 [Cichorium intybus]
MVDDGTTARQQVDDGGHGNPRPNPTTPPPSPSRTPRRTRRAGATTPSKLSPAVSSTTLPPPPTPPTPPADRLVTGTSSSSLGTQRVRRSKSVICPICKKDMCHEKALCGHIRWHTHEERQAASSDIARALSSNFSSGHGGEEQGPSKRFKVPDLNKPPPPEEDDGA